MRASLKQRFQIVKKLGQGTYGKVQLAINKDTGQEVAIKTIKKSRIESEQDLVRIRREIKIMFSIQHPHIIHIFEVFENKEKIVLIMQYASGGELYEYVSERKVLNDNEARRIFRQIATAVYYCHKNKICHRDLKLENILLDERGNAKIGDFGLSNVFDEKHFLSTFCGSPLYASPEIVKGTSYFGPEVDCWSMGVLLYTLVYGAMPFDGSNFKRLVKQISESNYYEPEQKSEASTLIKRLLTVNPAKRATIVDICTEPWVNSGFDNTLLQVAEDMANLTPVRMDLLKTLVPVSPTKAEPPSPSALNTSSPNVASGDRPLPEERRERRRAESSQKVERDRSELLRDKDRPVPKEREDAADRPRRPRFIKDSDVSIAQPAAAVPNNNNVDKDSGTETAPPPPTAPKRTGSKQSAAAANSKARKSPPRPPGTTANNNSAVKPEQIATNSNNATAATKAEPQADTKETITQIPPTQPTQQTAIQDTVMQPAVPDKPIKAQTNAPQSVDQPKAVVQDVPPSPKAKPTMPGPAAPKAQPVVPMDIAEIPNKGLDKTGSIITDASSMSLSLTNGSSSFVDSQISASTVTMSESMMSGVESTIAASEAQSVISKSSMPTTPPSQSGQQSPTSATPSSSRKPSLVSSDIGPSISQVPSRAPSEVGSTDDLRASKPSIRRQQSLERRMSTASTGSKRVGRLSIPNFDLINKPAPSKKPIPSYGSISDAKKKLLERRESSVVSDAEHEHVFPLIPVVEAKKECERRSSVADPVSLRRGPNAIRLGSLDMSEQSPIRGRLRRGMPVSSLSIDETCMSPPREEPTSTAQEGGTAKKDESSKDEQTPKVSEIRTESQDHGNDELVPYTVETPSVNFDQASKMAAFRARAGANVDQKSSMEVTIPGSVDGADSLISQPIVAKPGPITRSYKKVSFTKDGACITETGKVEKHEGPDGTITTVERKSKITTYPATDDQGQVNSQCTTETISTSSSAFGGNNLIKEDDLMPMWPPMDFPKLTLPPQFTRLTSPPLLFGNELLAREDTASPVQSTTTSSSTAAHNRPNSVTRSESASSSGSVDIFDDIFDTWAGDQIFNSMPTRFKSMLPSPFFNGIGRRRTIQKACKRSESTERRPEPFAPFTQFNPNRCEAIYNEHRADSDAGSTAGSCSPTSSVRQQRSLFSKNFCETPPIVIPESSSLLDQLRAHGYKNLVSQRLDGGILRSVPEQPQPPEPAAASQAGGSGVQGNPGQQQAAACGTTVPPQSVSNLQSLPSPPTMLPPLPSPFAHPGFHHQYSQHHSGTNNPSMLLPSMPLNTAFMSPPSSLGQEESVQQRIHRKSFYSRFNDDLRNHHPTTVTGSDHHQHRRLSRRTNTSSLAHVLDALSDEAAALLTK